MKNLEENISNIYVYVEYIYLVVIIVRKHHNCSLADWLANHFYFGKLLLPNDTPSINFHPPTKYSKVWLIRFNISVSTLLVKKKKSDYKILLKRKIVGKKLS